MKKLTLILDQTNWLEATLIEEITTQVSVEKETEVDGKIVKETILEDKIETIMLWCESYSGHKEHIAMLRNKVLEFGTSLDEYEDLITECESKFIYPTDEEIAKEELKNKIAEAQYLLDSTQFKFGDDYDKKNTPEWEELKIKRQEAREFIRANK